MTRHRQEKGHQRKNSGQRGKDSGYLQKKSGRQEKKQRGKDSGYLGKNNGRQGKKSGQGKPDQCLPESTDSVPSRLDQTEIILTVCELVLAGMSCTKIVDWMKKNYNVQISVRDPLKFLRRAVDLGWLKMHPPGYFRLHADMRKKYPWIEGLEVVPSTSIKHVARQAAVVLRRLANKHAQVKNGKRSAHIGLAGGGLTGELSWEFTQLLREHAGGWPDEIVIHGMASGLQLGNPTADPTAIFVKLLESSLDIQTELHVVGFPGPGIVDPDQIDVDSLKNWADIQEVMAQAEQLDIIVTSAGNWSDKHSTYTQTMKSSQRTVQTLESAHVRGDMLWQPVNEHGPIVIDTGVRILTLVELGFLPQFIARGKKVLVLLGPCAECRQPKSDILRTLLVQKDRLFTHLVADSRSIRHAI